MKERKRRVYINWTPVTHKGTSGRETFTTLARCVQTSTSRAHSGIQRHSVYSKPSESRLFDSILLNRRKFLTDLQKTLYRLSGLLTVLSAVLTLLCFILVTDERQEDTAKIGLKCGIWVTAMSQLLLVVVFWHRKQTYEKVMYSALKSSSKSGGSMHTDTIAVVKCGSEALLHALNPIPGNDFVCSFTLFGYSHRIRIDCIYFMLVLLRNYHIFRLLSWSSSLYSLRLRSLMLLHRSPLTHFFSFKFFSASLSLRFILGLYALMVILCGFSQFAIDSSASPADGLWLIAITQTTIGYGDEIPNSALGQAALGVSCFFGILVLASLNTICGGTANMSSAQFRLYAQLVLSRNRTSYSVVSVVLIQRWWRLVTTRKKTSERGRLVLLFYGQLTLHSQLTIKSHTSVCEHSLEGQTSSLESEVSRKTKRLCEYIRPILDVKDVVTATQATDVCRVQYRIKSQLWKLARKTRKYAGRERSGGRTSQELPLSRRENSIQVGKITTKGMAKARQSVFLSVMGRLVKDSQSSIASSFASDN